MGAIEAIEAIIEKYEIGFVAAADLVLPPIKSNLLRSAFGATIRAIGCRGQHGDAGHPNKRCVYAKLFQGVASNRPSGMAFVPPYHIYCGDTRTTIARGDTLMVEFALFVPHLFPDIIDIWEDVGKRGLGRRENTLVLDWYRADQYESGSFGGDIVPLASDGELTLSFLSACRLENNGEIVREPTIADFVRAAWRRTKLLTEAWIGGLPEWAPKSLIQAAEREIEVIGTSFEFQPWTRRSTAQAGRQIPMGGFTGSMRIRGQDFMRPFLPLLGIAHTMGIGHGVTAGNGHVDIRIKYD